MDLNQSHRDEVFLSLTNLSLCRAQLSCSILCTGWDFFFLLWNPLDNAYSLLPIVWTVVFSPYLYFNLVQTFWWCVTGGPQLTVWCVRCTVGIPQWHSCKPNHESQFMVTTLYFNFPWELWPVSGLEPVRKLENCFQVLSVKIKTTCWALRRKKGIRVLVV